MKRLNTTGLMFKILLFSVCYFWDVALSTSGHKVTSEEDPRHKVLRSEQIQPVTDKITDELTNPADFEHLESAISYMMRKYNIKGASAAVAKDGRLVYTKGFGYADAEAQEPVKPKHLFRVASVSKLITATAIMKMTELNLLNIDDKVFGKKGILNDSIYLDYFDPRVEKITVRHLLNHSAGWNRRYGDPMNMHHTIASKMRIDVADVKLSERLLYTLNQPLHFDPGSRTSYSNLGYAILGKIIEAITGMEYEAFVRQAILSPLGIQEMRIGKNLLEDRFENEVKYYDLTDNQNAELHDRDKVPLAYGGNDIETLGAAGGWIASPAEVLKLVVAIDSLSGAPNILSPESINLMTDTRLSGGHPIGWAGSDGQGNWWRTGTLAGTSALVMRQNDGTCWAVFFNSSTCKGIHFPAKVHREVHAALNKLEQWPDHDLFYHFDAQPHLYPDLAELQ